MFLFKNNNALTFSELKFDLNLLMVSPVAEKILSDDVEVDGILRRSLKLLTNLDKTSEQQKRE